MMARILPLLAASFLLFSPGCDEVLEPAPPDEVEEPEEPTPPEEPEEPQEPQEPPPPTALAGSTIWSIVANPTNENIIYAGSYSALFKSMDGGATWLQTSIQNHVSVIAIDPRDDNTLYCGTYTGGNAYIYKTVDSGVTWTQSNGLYGGWYTDIAIDPQHPDTLFAGAFFMDFTYGLLFRSLNGGANWEILLYGTPLWHKTVYAVAIDPLNTQTIYAGLHPSVYKSLDHGATWTDLSLPYAYVTDLLVHPDRPEIIYAGTYHGVYVSRDGGDSWQAANAGITDSSLRVSEIVYKAPQKLYLATWRGVYVSDSDTIQWSRLVNNVIDENNEVYTLEVTSNGDILLGTWNGFHRFAAEIDSVNGP